MWFSDTNYHNNDGDNGQAIDYVYGSAWTGGTKSGIFHDNDIVVTHIQTGSPI